jgi:disulfide bond formation protein DsbB
MFIILFLISLALTAGSYIMQFIFKLEPCQLCLAARALVLFLTCLFGIAALQRPKQTGEFIYRTLGGLLAAYGVLVTIRHVWLLHQPQNAPPDGFPELDYFLTFIPFKETLVLTVRGAYDRSEQISFFLGLSLPTWTMFGFIVILILTIMPWRFLK